MTALTAHSFLTFTTYLKTPKTTSNCLAVLIYDILFQVRSITSVTEFSLCLETPVRSAIVSVSIGFSAVPSQI